MIPEQIECKEYKYRYLPLPFLSLADWIQTNCEVWSFSYMLSWQENLYWIAKRAKEIMKLVENRFVVTTPTQPQLNSKVGCDMKMTLVHPPPPPPPTTTHTNSKSSLSQLFLTRFLPNFKGRYVGSTTTIITTTWTTTTTTATKQQQQDQQKQHFIYYWPDFNQTFNWRFLG